MFMDLCGAMVCAGPPMLRVMLTLLIVGPVMGIKPPTPEQHAALILTPRSGCGSLHAFLKHCNPLWFPLTYDVGIAQLFWKYPQLTRIYIPLRDTAERLVGQYRWVRRLQNASDALKLTWTLDDAHLLTSPMMKGEARRRSYQRYFSGIGLNDTRVRGICFDTLEASARNISSELCPQWKHKPGFPHVHRTTEPGQVISMDRDLRAHLYKAFPLERDIYHHFCGSIQHPPPPPPSPPSPPPSPPSHATAVCELLVSSIMGQCAHDLLVVNVLNRQYANYVKPWSSMVSSSEFTSRQGGAFIIAMDKDVTAAALAAGVPHFDASGHHLHAKRHPYIWTAKLPAALSAWKFMAVVGALRAHKRVIMSEIDVLYDQHAAFRALLASKAVYTGMLDRFSGEATDADLANASMGYNAGFFLTQGPEAERFFSCLLDKWLAKPSDVLGVDQLFMNNNIHRERSKHGTNTECIPITHTGIDPHVYSSCRHWHKNASRVEVAHICYCRRLNRDPRTEHICKLRVLAAFYSAPFPLKQLENVGEDGGLVPGC